MGMYTARILFYLLATLVLPLAASAADIVVDNDTGAPGYVETGTWTSSASTGYNGTTYRFTDTYKPLSTATWTPTLMAAGRYEVFAALLRSSNRTSSAPYTITHVGGSTVVFIDQRGTGVGEISLGTFEFSAGTSGKVVLTNTGQTGAHIADAIIFRPVSGPENREYRCIWADSWNSSFLNQSEAQNLVDTCRANYINTVIVEVRKTGDAYYSSAFEPRATNISGGSTYDPLGTLIQLAHDTSNGQKRIEVHAWFVMHRISKGETLASSHVLSQHPEYEMLKSDGTRDSTNRFLDPGHPGTVEHNLKVVLDCLSKYDLDGINFDYIRYPETTGAWGYNTTSVQRFNALYGRTGTPSSTDAQWSNWRRECVTLEVKKIYFKAWKLKPWVAVSADTVNWGSAYTNWTASSAYAGVFQDWVGWLQAGILDYNALMSYATDDARYMGWGNLSLANDDSRGSIIGIGAYLQTTIQASMTQLLWARTRGASGLNIYDWGSETNAVSGGSSAANRAAFYAALKAQVFRAWADPPLMTWKTNRMNGLIEGNVTLNGQPVDHATVQIDGIAATATVTDGKGWFGIMDVPQGFQNVRFSKTGQPDVVKQVNVYQPTMPITVDADFNQAGVEDWAAYLH